MTNVEKFVKESGLDIKEYDSYYYGYKEIADQILGFLLDGSKRATTGLKIFYDVEKEELPKVGNYAVILDSKEEPRCITRITKVEIVKFKDITEEYAYREGEGDKSLDYWKREHEKVFTKECKEELGISFHDEMECVCEYFEVVYKK